METMTVNGKEYEVLKLLGKGKGGYSYLVREGEKLWGIRYWSKTPEFLRYVEDHT